MRKLWMLILLVSLTSSCKKNKLSAVDEKYPVANITYRIAYYAGGAITPSTFRAYYWQNDTSVHAPSYSSEQKDWGGIIYGVNEKATTLRKRMGYWLRAHSWTDGNNWKLYVLNENGVIIDSSKPPYPFNQSLGYYDVTVSGTY